MAFSRTSKSALVVTGLGFGMALGLAAGTLVIAPNLDGASSTAVSGDEALREEHRDLLQKNKDLSAQSNAADSLVSNLSADAISGVLDGRDVAIIATADATERDVDGIRAMLDAAGASDSGTISMANEFLHPDSADKLKSIVANVLPAGAELDEQDLSAGRHTGQALAAALLRNPDTTEPLATPEDRGALLKSLREAGLINYEDGTILPAQAVVVVMGRGGDKYYHDNLVSFTHALKEAGRYTVVAGRLNAANEGGVLDTLRKESASESDGAQEAISTVDSINRKFAQLATALAVVEQIDGDFGAYGAGEDVDATAPPMPQGE